MKDYLRIVLAALAMVVFFQSGWVCYSDDSKCPTMQPDTPPDRGRFLSAHGLTQETFSIWLKEHSVWRKQYSDELEQYSFIPQDYDTDRGGQ